MDFAPLPCSLPSQRSPHAKCIQSETRADGHPYGLDFTPDGDCRWSDFTWDRYILRNGPALCPDLTEKEKFYRREDHCIKCLRCRANRAEIDTYVPVTLRQMQGQKDLELYARIATAEPRYDEDFLSPDELQIDVAAGTIRAWLAFDDGECVGWCCVLIPSPHHPAPQAIHMLGSIVVPEKRGKGYGYAMMAARIALFPGVPLTASCAPGNDASEHVLARHDFRPGLAQSPWITWHRRSPLYRMGLYADQRSLEDAITAGEVDYGEVFTRFTADERGRVWPDSAAFLHVDARLGDVVNVLT